MLYLSPDIAESSVIVKRLGPKRAETDGRWVRVGRTLPNRLHTLIPSDVR